MTNREFDRWLRESLSSFQPEYDPSQWEDLTKRIAEEEQHEDMGFDEQIRRAVLPLGSEAPPDWTHMEQMLDADEHAFDTQIRETVEHLSVPYTPESWSALHTKVDEDDRMRRRLIRTKVLEVAAILIALFTFSNFFPVIRNSVIQSSQEDLAVVMSPTNSGDNNIGSPQHTVATTPDVAIFSSAGTILNESASVVHESASAENTGSAASMTNQNATASGASHDMSAPRAGEVVQAFSLPVSPFDQVVSQQNQSVLPAQDNHGIAERASIMTIGNLPSQDISSLSYHTGNLSGRNVQPLLPVAPKIRFGMMTSADVNVLFFPKERFYSQGRAFSFSEKEIIAGGYSAGISISYEKEKISIESGLIYSSKTFGPDRKFFIGSSTDSRSLDFENIALDIVSIPLYVHWKIDRSGWWRVYATGGAAVHVIANANYDLVEEIIFSSAAPPQGTQQQQIHEREIQRIRQHMLDGAEFSTKGYVTASAGFGIERYLNRRMSVFAQPLYHYQIPFFGLIDQNGKHLQNGSLLLGTRVSL